MQPKILVYWPKLVEPKIIYIVMICRCSQCYSFVMVPQLVGGYDYGGVLSAGGTRAADSDIWSVRWTSFSFQYSFYVKKKTRRPILLVDDRFCFVLFSFDRHFPKNVKTYSTEELNILVLYVFTFFGKCLSKENKTKQNRFRLGLHNRWIFSPTHVQRLRLHMSNGCGCNRWIFSCALFCFHV